MKKEELLEYEQMKQKALEQLRSGKSLYGKDGAFAPLLKSFLDAALEAELESHLDEFERSNGNRRNGKTSKDVVPQWVQLRLRPHETVPPALNLS